jgi:hypothetical protein
MTAHTAICQTGTGIDWKALMKDVLRLDSCEATSSHLHHILEDKDSLLAARYMYILHLEGVIQLQDSVMAQLRYDLSDCIDELEKLVDPPLWKRVLKGITSPWFFIPTSLVVIEGLLLFAK